MAASAAPKLPEFVSFQNCRDVVGSLPIGSAVDEAIQWLNRNDLMSKPFIVKLPFNINDDKKGAIKESIARFCAAIALPSIAKVGVVYNLAAGTSHLVFGCVAHIKKLPRDEVAKEFDMAFTHFLTATYDFAIGYFLAIQQLGMVLALGFAVLPQFAMQGHDYVFARATKDTSDTDATQVVDNYNLKKGCAIQIGAQKMTESLVPNDTHKTWTAKFKALLGMR